MELYFYFLFHFLLVASDGFVLLLVLGQANNMSKQRKHGSSDGRQPKISTILDVRELLELKVSLAQGVGSGVSCKGI